MRIAGKLQVDPYLVRHCRSSVNDLFTFTRCQAASGIAVLAIGSFVTAIGLNQTTLSPDPPGPGHVLAQPDTTLNDNEVTLNDTKVINDREVIRGPGKRPIMERPPVVQKPPRVPPIKELPRLANEGVGNGVDGNTPGHDNNGGNDDPQFSPGNPGAKN